MGFDWGGFTTGFGALMTAFIFGWAFGVAARVIDWGGE